MAGVFNGRCNADEAAAYLDRISPAYKAFLEKYGARGGFILVESLNTALDEKILGRRFHQVMCFEYQDEMNEKLEEKFGSDIESDTAEINMFRRFVDDLRAQLLYAHYLNIQEALDKVKWKFVINLEKFLRVNDIPIPGKFRLYVPAEERERYESDILTEQKLDQILSAYIQGSLKRRGQDEADLLHEGTHPLFAHRMARTINDTVEREALEAGKMGMNREAALLTELLEEFDDPRVIVDIIADYAKENSPI